MPIADAVLVPSGAVDVPVSVVVVLKMSPSEREGRIRAEGSPSRKKVISSVTKPLVELRPAGAAYLRRRPFLCRPREWTAMPPRPSFGKTFERAGVRQEFRPTTSLPRHGLIEEAVSRGGDSLALREIAPAA